MIALSFVVESRGALETLATFRIQRLWRESR